MGARGDRARPARRDRGAVVPFVAILLPVLMLATAFAVDLGRQRALRRDLQADADVIALDLARMADGRTEDQIVGAASYVGDVGASFTRNDRTAPTAAQLAQMVEWGRWDQTQCGAIVTNPDSCFVPTTGTQIPNAVQVALEGSIGYYFQPGTGRAERSSVAAQDKIGSFSIGSRLASLDTNESPLLGPLLGALLGSPDAIQLSALGYQGLVGLDLDLASLLNLVDLELASAGVNVGSPDEILGAEITALQLVNVAASALRASGSGVEADAALAYLDLLALNIDPDVTLTLGELLNVGVSNPGAVLDTEVNLFDLLMLGAQAANGDNLVSVPLTLSPALLGSIPLINRIAALEATLQVGVIEGPQIATGPIGTQARTSQIRILLGVTADLDVSLEGLLAPIPVPGLLPSVVRVRLNLPVTVEVANGRATLVALQCAVPEDQSILGLAVATSAARALIGTIQPGAELVDVGSTTAAAVNLATVELLGIDLATVELGSAVEVGVPTSERLDLPVGASDSVRAGQLGLANLVQLQANLRLLDNVPLLGPIIGAVLTPLLGPIISGVLNLVLLPVLDLIDTTIVRPLLDLLGVGVAAADVTAISADCENLKLVE